MLYYDFGDYEGFKKRFGIERDEKGKLLRKNKILLSFIKNRNMLHCAARYNYESPYWRSVINTDSLSKAVKEVHLWMSNCSEGYYVIHLNGSTYFSDTYKTDCMKGIPEDGSIGFIRYMNMKYGGKVYKMKAGKMYKHILDNNKMSVFISDEMKTYMCEVLTEKWKAYQESSCSYELHVDKKFWKIYDSEFLDGDFGSCMTDNEYYDFYKKVDASAAYLTRQSDGLILARCVIFNEVRDMQGNTYRLAERQYASGGNLVYMRMLVNRLKEGGYIDGHKAIGAGCREAMNFVLNDGERLNRKLWIEANLKPTDTISYQDSFKWYVPENGCICNFQPNETYFSLDETDGKIGGINYDEWHECYTFNDTVTCYYRGNRYYVDEEQLDEFIEVHGEYWHEDEVRCCNECEELYTDEEEHYYSELTEGCYCCIHCLEKAEERYRAEHGIEDAA